MTDIARRKALTYLARNAARPKALAGPARHRAGWISGGAAAAAGASPSMAKERRHEPSHGTAPTPSYPWHPLDPVHAVSARRPGVRRRVAANRATAISRTTRQ